MALVRRGLVLLLVLCGGCAGGDDPRSEPSSRVYELALHGTFERDGYLAQGTSILEIDPITLRPLVRRGHRLRLTRTALSFHRIAGSSRLA